MSAGEKAGDATRNIFKTVGDVGESIRKNVNSFADDVGDGVAGRKHHGGHSNFGSSNMSHDANKLQKDAQKGVDDAGKKLDDMLHKAKK